MGEDEIKYEAWIFGQKHVEEIMTKILNKIWREEEIPEEWKRGILCTIFKKGEKNKSANYRSITLMDTGYKIYTNILREKLQEEIKKNEIYSEPQLGFRRNSSTIDAIYILKNAIDRQLIEGNKIHTCFVDLKAAFDNVDRGEMLKMMREGGIEEKLCIGTETIYKETLNKVRINGKIIGEFYTEKGVRQECSLSADCFNIYLSDLEKELQKCSEGGLLVGRKKIWSPTYADDIGLVAMSREALRHMLKRLEIYLKNKKLQLNSKKRK